MSEAVDKVRIETGSDVHLVGYSQGGMFCYQAAAYRRNEGIAGLVTFGSPVDMRGTAPLKLPEPWPGPAPNCSAGAASSAAPAPLAG